MRGQKFEVLAGTKGLNQAVGNRCLGVETLEGPIKRIDAALNGINNRRPPRWVSMRELK